MKDITITLGHRLPHEYVLTDEGWRLIRMKEFTLTASSISELGITAAKAGKQMQALLPMLMKVDYTVERESKIIPHGDNT